MPEGLQSVTSAAGNNGGVISVFLVTVSTGAANAFEAMQPIIGALISIATFIIFYKMSKKKDRLYEKEIELRDAQISVINERKESRGETK